MVHASEEVFGIVETGIYKPFGVGHGGILQNGGGLLRGDNAKVVPHALPEVGYIIHRPLP